MRLMIAAMLLAPAPLAAQDVGPALNPTLMTGWAGGEAARHDAERRARKGRPARQSDYERWRNRPGKRDCGSYNWKCPAKPRSSR